MYISKNKKRIYANDEIQEPVVNVESDATDLLFEAEDVANLIAEVTESDVEVEVADDGDSVSFTVGDAVYNVEAEGDEEVVEASTRVGRRAGKRVTASRRPSGRRVSASTRTRNRSVRRTKR